MKTPSASTDLVYRRSERGLDYPKQVQYDEYDGDDDQSVNPTACLRETWANSPSEKAEQP